MTEAIVNRLTPLAADEIRWTPEPIPSPDPLVLTDEDLIVAALQDAEAYRTALQVAIHQLHNLTRQLDRLREQHQRLVAEYRYLRERTMRKAVGGIS